jgi:GT2 family glycosyltransferase
VTERQPRDLVRRDLLAVLVLYRQPLERSPTFVSLEADLQAMSTRLRLVVYDNSPVPIGRPGEGSRANWDLLYVHDPSNPGVARAYLEGARIAEREGRRWLLLLDQDTEFPPGALASYIAAIDANPDVRLFAPILRAGSRIVSPCAYRFSCGFPLATVAPGPQSLAGRSVLNSGMCIALNDYLAVGGHDPRIELDFADHEFVGRFKRRYTQFAVVDATCRHGLSAVEGSGSGDLTRFRLYCRGALKSAAGPLDAALAVGLVMARGCLLSIRHRSLGYLRIAATALAQGPRR